MITIVRSMSTGNNGLKRLELQAMEEIGLHICAARKRAIEIGNGIGHAGHRFATIELRCSAR